MEPDPLWTTAWFLAVMLVVVLAVGRMMHAGANDPEPVTEEVP